MDKRLYGFRRRLLGVVQISRGVNEAAVADLKEEISRTLHLCAQGQQNAAKTHELGRAWVTVHEQGQQNTAKIGVLSSDLVLWGFDLFVFTKP